MIFGKNTFVKATPVLAYAVESCYIFCHEKGACYNFRPKNMTMKNYENKRLLKQKLMILKKYEHEKSRKISYEKKKYLDYPYLVYDEIKGSKYGFIS